MSFNFYQHAASGHVQSQATTTSRRHTHRLDSEVKQAKPSSADYGSMSRQPFANGPRLSNRGTLFDLDVAFDPSHEGALPQDYSSHVADPITAWSDTDTDDDKEQHITHPQNVAVEPVADEEEEEEYEEYEDPLFAPSDTLLAEGIVDDVLNVFYDGEEDE